MRNRENGENENEQIVSYGVRAPERGAILLLILMILLVISTITIYFLYMTSVQLKGSGHDLNDSKAFWLAEAGMQKAIWNLMTPVASGGMGSNWTTLGTTENLGDGSYTMEVAIWDFALAVNGASASASSSTGANVPANAIDGNDATFWESGNKLDKKVNGFAEIIINFPSEISLHRARFISPSAQNRPKDFTWEVSSDGITYNVVLTVNNNNLRDRTDGFIPFVTNVRYLKLRATLAGGNKKTIQVGTLEVAVSKITATGNVDLASRKVEQTVVANEAAQTAYAEKNWAEIMP